MVGSAQMISRSALLQHGSLPLSNKFREIHRYFLEDPLALAKASSINEELGREVSLGKAREAFVEAAGELHQLVESELNPWEQSRSEELFRVKYARDEWNRKR